MLGTWRLYAFRSLRENNYTRTIHTRAHNRSKTWRTILFVSTSFTFTQGLWHHQCNIQNREAYSLQDATEKRRKVRGSINIQWNVCQRSCWNLKNTFAINVWEKCKGCKTLDELKYKHSSQTDMAANMLPPTEDSFYHHVMRCLYQTKLWCNSHIAKPTVILLSQLSLIQMVMVGICYRMEPLISNFSRKKQHQRHFEMSPTCIVLMTSALMPLIVNVC